MNKFLPIPGASTLIGVAAGMYLGHLIDNYDLDFLGGKSVSEATKDTLTDFFGG